MVATCVTGPPADTPRMHMACAALDSTNSRDN